MTRKSILFPMIAAVGLVLSATPALTEDGASKAEYLAGCALCHGPEGRGDGEVGKLLTVEVPDLTQLAARNDGAFPMLDVIHIIDGRTGVRGHGTQMPIWGNAFRDTVGDDAGTFGSETLVRGRILSLAYYLESIQE